MVSGQSQIRLTTQSHHTDDRVLYDVLRDEYTGYRIRGSRRPRLAYIVRTAQMGAYKHQPIAGP